jgi:peptidoglycan/LPS O-acetylase OafA/YrhL
MTILAYRRDIDGLRAIAVLAVVLFHFGVPGITGGFVGVDVFFVISGFLITSIIWRERQAGRFSFVDFWARRARRILPALFVMMAATLAVGWFLLAPKDYEELGRSAHYQVTFTSNLLFARQHGYFDASSDIKPLLHTWSLAVEEQFYIFFPLLLALLSSRLKHWRLALFAVLLVSFGMSVWAVSHQPQKAFYLLHLRAWELLAGAMLAVMPKVEWRASPPPGASGQPGFPGIDPDRHIRFRPAYTVPWRGRFAAGAGRGRVDLGQWAASHLGRAAAEFAADGGAGAYLLFLVSVALAGVRVRQLRSG